jgi:hypothetical protein
VAPVSGLRGRAASWFGPLAGRREVRHSDLAPPRLGVSLWPVVLRWALDEVFTGYYGGPLDIEGVPDLAHLPWIDPTHPS